jgi:hypothetical protein
MAVADGKGREESLVSAAVCDAGDASGKCVQVSPVPGERANRNVLWAVVRIVEFLLSFAASWRGGNMGACLHRSDVDCCHDLDDACNTAGHARSVSLS